MSSGLGLDLATKITGWFLMSDQSDSSGALVGRGGIIKSADWIDNAEQVEKLLADLKPAWVAIEDTYLNMNAQKQAINPQTRKMLDNLAGHVVVECHKLAIPVYRGTAPQINAACGIEPYLPRDKRKKALKMFAERLGYQLPQDTCDALAAAFWGKGEARKDEWLKLTE